MMFLSSVLLIAIRFASATSSATSSGERFLTDGNQDMANMASAAISDELRAAYDRLGLAVHTQKEDEIRAAYRRASRQNHPDKGGDPEEFRKIRHSYDLLMSAGLCMQDPPEMISLLSDGEDYEDVSDEEHARAQQLAEIQRLHDANRRSHHAIEERMRQVAAHQGRILVRRREQYVSGLFDVLRVAGQKKHVYLSTRERLKKDRADISTTYDLSRPLSVSETEECGARLQQVSREWAQLGDVEPPAVTVTIRAVSKLQSSRLEGGSSIRLELQSNTMHTEHHKLHFQGTTSPCDLVGCKTLIPLIQLILDADAREACYRITEVARWTEQVRGEDHVEYCGFDGAPYDYCSQEWRRTATYHTEARQKTETTCVTYQYDTTSGVWVSPVIVDPVCSHGGDGEVKFYIGDFEVTPSYVKDEHRRALQQ